MNYFKDESGAVYAYDDEQVAQGYGTDMTAMTPEEVDAHLNPTPVVVVPERVTMRQARLALLQAGLLDDTEALIASLEGPEGQAARIEWDYSSEVHRHKPFVQSLGTQLGFTDEQLDQLFITASQID